MGIREIDSDNFSIRNGKLVKYVGNSVEIVSVPDGITEIDDTAFVGHFEIKTISIPDSVKRIGQYAFVSCTSLRHVCLGLGIKNIPMGCFMGLHNLESVTLYDTIESIDDFAFRGCKSLREFQFLSLKQREPVTPEEKGMAFEAMMLGKPSTISYVDKADHTPSVLRIGNFAFAECPGFDGLELKEKAEQLGISAFDEEKEDVILSEPDSSVYESENDIFVEEKDIKPFDLSGENDAEVNNSLSEGYREEPKKDSYISIIKEDVDKSELLIDGASQQAQANTEDNNHDAECLVDGFITNGDLIICQSSGETIADASIGVLGLSNRAFNCLNRARINNAPIAKDDQKGIMISDILNLSFDRLVNIRNMGTKSAEEVIERVRTYLLNEAGIEGGYSSNEAVIAPGYDVIDGVITELKTGRLIADISVESLGLSVRAKNSLRGGGIHSLSALIKSPAQQLMHLSNMGAKTVSEIKDFVPAYLESHRVDSLDVEESKYEVPSTISVSMITKIDPDVPVLAPEYVVVDGIIYNRKTFKTVPDASVETLDLSVRSLNCLMRSNKQTIASLIGMPFADFRQIRNLGVMSANEIQEKLEQYLDRKQAVSIQQAVPDKTVSSTEVLLSFKDNEFEAKSFESILELLPNASEKDLLEVLNKLVEDQRVLFSDGLYSLHHPSFYEYIQSLDASSGIDERAIRILQQRAAGSTLEEVGQLEGTTRERIRQIEKKSLRRITKGDSLLFEEDKYAYLFSTYSFDREFYFDYLGETKQIWHYLNFRYSRGKTDPGLALQDRAIPTSARRAIDKYIHKGYVEIDGVYIPIQRGEIEDYVVEKYCKDEVTLDEFFELYDCFLKDYDLTDERLQVTDSMRMTRSNRLSESNRLLWKQNQRLRFYDIEGGDYSELFETLNLGQYKDIELSSRKFIVDYPELMERYDLRDEYEVHNLLKKIHAESENPDLVFGRMPNLQFGVFDRDAAVKEILFALAPVSMDDLAIMISLEYGVRPETVKANWLGCVSEYYHQGMYSIDYEDMPEEHIAILRERLTEDFYFLHELRRIYSSVIPDADLTLLSTYNLKKMGFLVGASYVIQHYSTAEAYFAHLLTDSDVVDVAPISKRYTGLTTYSAYLARLKHEMEIIEFEPFQYINIRRLQKLGFTKEKLKEYSDRVWSYLVDDDYFTIQSLKRSGFADELDALGFGDMFYSSILKEDERFSWQRVGSNVVLNPKGEQFTVHDFLVDRITREQSVDIDDFVSDLSDIYGIFFNRSEIIEKIKGSDVYYDSIMEKLYADYATYFEEI